MTTQLSGLTPEQALEILDRLEAESAAAVTEQESLQIAVIIEGFIRGLRLQQWEPYPWQHPHQHPDGWVSERAPGKNVCDERCVNLPATPIPTHGIWKQRGGRGTGKTEGAAHYINAHAEGPPCDTRVPGGHRFTIVGPTQADAVSACVEGVSGLKAINAGITVTTGREGTLVKWPNGSVGRVLGANSAKDVDRARAWTNVCVAHGSLVQTEHGPVPIEDVRPGDQVWTRTGLREVLHARHTGVRPVMRITADGADVWVTPDHPVALADGTFTRADQIRRKVLVWTEEESSTQGSSGPCGLTGTTSAGSGYSTGTSTPMRSDRSLPGSTYTTPTTTRPTTHRGTSSPSPLETMLGSIRSLLTGTLLGAAYLRLLVRLSMPSAVSAGPRSARRVRPPAPRPVRTAVPRHAHSKDGCAACAATGTPARSGTRPAPVPRDAELSPPTRHADVYDLAVAGHHEFYAGGLLVGNCVWWLEEAAAMTHLGGLTVDDPTAVPGMLDQARFTLRLGSNPHMVTTTTPRNRPEVTKLLAMEGPETWGRTQDAHRLDPAVRTALELIYRGTTAGLQELDGEQIADTPGALWVSVRPDLVDGIPNTDHRPGIDNDRLTPADVGWTVHARPTGLQGDGHVEVRRPDKNTPVIVQRVVVAVDPPGGRTECGIVVVGASGQHGYVLADLSTAAPPDTWAKIVLEAYYDFGAEGLAVELTYGGNNVSEVINSRAELLGVPPPPIHRMATKVGKRLRAEPVQGLYQQHRIHHVGQLVGLETEMRTWIPDQTTESPNRIDALVHGVNYLLISARPGAVSNPAAAPVRMPTTFGNAGVARRR